MPRFALERRDLGVLVSMPHVGTWLPKQVAARLTPPARTLPDTDWLLVELYDFLEDLGVSRLHAIASRQLVDLNRPPDDIPLYATTTTGLVPTELFDGTPCWSPGQAPDAAEVAQRVHDWWRPYHRALQGELSRLTALHGRALLLDLHSIRSVVPRLFDGQLPDLNLGTDLGRSASAPIAERLVDCCEGMQGLTHVLNGRFRGGFITRHYGRPDDGVHAVQLELSQRTYLHEEGEPVIAPHRAAAVRPHLRRFVEVAIEAWRDLP